MENIQGLFALENKILGKGSFGTVYLGTDISKDKYVALKQIPNQIMRDPQQLQLLSNEILISSGIHHENLVNILDIYEINNAKYIVYEFCNGGDLRRYLNFFNRFDENLVQYCMKQILCGLSAIHSKGIIHHDLKPENILVELFPNNNKNKVNPEEKMSYEKIIDDILQITDKNSMNYMNIDKTYKDFVYKSLLKSKIKVSDFGLSKFKGDNNQRAISGSPVYMDPNLFIQNVDIRVIESEKVDIWAIGIFAFELFFGFKPFNPSVQTLNELIRLLQKGIYVIDLYKCGQISKQFLSFLNMCLQREQNIRPTVTELLFSEFITRDTNKFNYINMNNINYFKFPNSSYLYYQGKIVMNIDDRRAVNLNFE